MDMMTLQMQRVSNVSLGAVTLTLQPHDSCTVCVWLCIAVSNSQGVSLLVGPCDCLRFVN